MLPFKERGLLLALVFSIVAAGCTGSTRGTGVTPLPTSTSVSPSAQPDSAPDVPVEASPYRWKTPRIPGGIDRVIETDGLVLVTSFGQPLRVFSAACGEHRATCSPLWRSATRVDGFAISGDRIYASAAFDAGKEDAGGLAVYPLHCRAVEGVCRPLRVDTVGPLSPRASNNLWWLGAPNRFTTPTIHDDIVYTSGSVDGGLTHPGQIFGPLYAFSATCSSSTGCAPLWRTKGLMGVGTPRIEAGLVFVPSSSGLYVFPEGCRADGGICRPLWHASTNIEGGSNVMLEPSVSNGLVYVTTSGDAGGGDAQRPGIFAYPVRCRNDGGLCGPAWWAPIWPWWRSTTPPSVVGDGVLVASLEGVVQYPITCQPERGVCKDRRLLSDGHSSYSIYPAPAIRGSTLVAETQRSGRSTGFDVFRVPCERSPCRPIGSWDPSRSIEQVVGAGRDEVFVAIPGGALGVAIGHGGDQPHVDWRWTSPGVRSISQITASGCTVYLVAGRELYSVRHCGPDSSSS